MKLLNDYRVRIDASMILMFIPIVVYYFLFREHIYNLVAGGFIFIYFTGLLAFINRYYREYIGKMTADKLGILTELKLKSLKPLTRYKTDMTADCIRKIEGSQILVIVLSNTVLFSLSYLINPSSYLTKVLLGNGLLSLLIFWKNIMYIIKSHQYKDCTFRYTDTTLKIYQIGEAEIIQQGVPALKKLWQYNESPTYHYFIQGMETGNIEFWSVVHNEEIVGELYIFWHSEDQDEADGKKRAYLCAFRIQDTYQGRGYGKELMMTVFDRIEARGYTEVTIGVDNDDFIRLKSMYEYFGFEAFVKYADCDHHYLDKDGQPVVSETPTALYLKKI